MASMSDRDATFLWESAAIRESPRRGGVGDRPSTAPVSSQNWVTLREAHYLTGIPVETLRKWGRRGSVPSFLDESTIGVRRMVRIDAVRGRADDLGRPIGPIPRPPVTQPDTQTPASPPSTVPTADSPSEELMEAAPAELSPRDEPQPAAMTAASAPLAPEGTMIVPIAAWDKMLMQLGNLHEAGQQLAEARERAAKAETEARFLRERLGEFRHDRQLSREKTPPPPAKPEPDATEIARATVPVVSESPTQPEKLWRYIYRGWRQRRK